MEHARNVCGLEEADHTEYRPDARVPLIVPVACPAPGAATDRPTLSGRMKITLAPGSLTARIYGVAQVKEGFHCSYELNPRFESALERGGLRPVGRGERDEVRIVELAPHRFFVATLFQPQLGSAPGAPHPLIRAYLEAALAFAETPPERR